MSDLTSGVTLKDGIPVFTINDEPWTSPIFSAYQINKKYFQQMAEAGCRAHMFVVEVGSGYGHSRECWLGPDSYDYSCIDERVEVVLEADPNALIMIRLYLAAPQWWLDANPQEALVLENGRTTFSEPSFNIAVQYDKRYASLGSNKWREDMAMALRQVVRHIEKSDYGERVFAYSLSGLSTEEWYHWGCCDINQLGDYSQPMTEAFRNWLRMKYGSVEELCHAWGCHNLTFEGVTIPTGKDRVGTSKAMFRNSEKDMHVIDFYSFYNEIIPETIDYFAGVVKDETGGRKTVGTLYCYMYEFKGDPEFGHNALGKMLESRNIDFFQVEPSYGSRQLGSGGDYVRGPAKSVALHGKVWYHDNDVASYRYPQIAQHKVPEFYASWLGVTRSAEESVWMYRRTVGFALGHGMHYGFFDLHGGYYDDPELLQGVKGICNVAEGARHHARQSTSEILVVTDERSTMYCTYGNAFQAASLHSTMHQMIKVGAPYDSILVDDLEVADLSQYKLVIFLNSYHLDDRQRDLIRTTVLRDGRTVLWCYAAGLFNGRSRSLDLMHDITGFDMQESPHAMRPRMEFSQVEHPIAEAIERLGWYGIDSHGVCFDAPYRPKEGENRLAESPKNGATQSEKLLDAIFVCDPKSTVLGTVPGTGMPVFAVKNMGTWTSIYSMIVNFPAPILREIARMAGVHIYSDQNDTLYTCSSYLTLHADGAGLRRVDLPYSCDVVDAFTGEQLGRQVTSFEKELRDGETLLVYLLHE